MPDTFAGAFTLIGINLGMVFVVLWVIGGVINITHRLANTFQPRETQESMSDREKHVMILSGSQSDALQSDTFQEGTTLPSNEMDGAARAAVMAALAVYTESPSRPSMFLRNYTDSGAWGRSSREYLQGGFGTYRSAARGLWIKSSGRGGM
ncbi:MAG: OadG family protein [Bacillota bacterium]|jgi:hypothetical protein